MYIGEVAVKYELSIFPPILQSKNIRCFSEDIGKGPGGHEAIVLFEKRLNSIVKLKFVIFKYWRGGYEI